MLIIVVAGILGVYVWDMIVYYKQQLYRDIVAVNVTAVYLLLMCLAAYAINLGWENVIKFIILQIYAIKLSYFLNNYEMNQKWHKLINNSNYE